MIQVFEPNSDYFWSWATLNGPDAQDFLHRITSVNVREMQLGHGARGCLLTPQGKLISIFTLWNYARESYAFEFEAGSQTRWKTALFAGIDRFTFSEKMTLTDVATHGGLECRWIFTEPSESSLAQLGTPELKPYQTVATDEEIRFCHHGDRDYGRPWISAWGRPEQFKLFLDTKLKSAHPIQSSQLEAWRILAISPRVDRELTDSTIPLEAGLVDAIAPNKGCYPGQEVIEKIISLGSPSKRLCLIEGSNADGIAQVAGTKLLSTAVPPAEIGELTSILKEGSRFYALGFVRKIHAKENFPIQFNLTQHSNSQIFTGTITRIAPYA